MRLSYDAPESCPTRQSFEARVVANNPRVQFLSTAEDLQVGVRLSGSGEDYRAIVRLLVRQSETVRELSGETCDEVQRAAAVVTAVVADDFSNTTVAPVMSPAPPAAAAPPPPRPRLRDDETPWRWGFGIQLGIDNGLGPDVVFHPRPLASLSKGPWSTRLSVARPQARSETSAGTAAFDWMLARAEGCYEVLSPESWLGPCAGFEGGFVEASGSKTRSPETESRAAAAGLLLARGGWRLIGTLTLEVDAGVRVPFTRQRFYFGENSEAYEVPVAAFTGGVGLHFRSW